MRKAAGILMVIYGVTAIGIYIHKILSELGSRGYNPPYYMFIIITLTVFFVTGGAFCLKRKYWALCFTSSLFLHFWMIASFLGNFYIHFWWYGFLLPGAILPLIFICLRKREWQAQEFQG